MAQVPDPVVQETAKAAFASGVEMLARLFERFDVQNPREHLGNLEAVANSLNAQQQGGNAALQGIQAAAPGADPGGGIGGQNPLDPGAINALLGFSQ